MKVNIQKLDNLAPTPAYATEGAAGFDFHAILPDDRHEVVIPSGDSAVFKTGLAFSVPAGHVMLVFSRSGHGFKNGVVLANGTGVIDSDYRGEVMLKLTNHGDAPFTVKSFDRVAQGVIVQHLRAEFNVVDALDDTQRGTGGFGSTGQ